MSARHNSRKTARRNSAARNCKSKSKYYRTLRYEPLEDRRLLAVVTVTTLADTIDFNDGFTSFREAIFAANTVAGADTIDFKLSLTAGGPATIVLTQGELKITDALTIAGPGADRLTIDASGSDPTPGVVDRKGSRIFNVDDQIAPQIAVSINGLRVTGGDTSSSGGAILSNEELHLTDDVIEQNAANYSVIYSRGVLTIDRNRVVNNTITSTLSGVGIINAGALTIRESEISGNIGSGVSTGGAAALIADTTVANNAGQGLILKSTGAQLLRSTISGNIGERGGVSFIGGGTLLISDSTISRNTGLSFNQGGGGAYFNVSGAGKVTIQNSLFVDNRGPSGGGILAKGSLEVFDSEFRGNAATSGNGGGISLGESSAQIVEIFVSGTTFRENTARQKGGAVYLLLPTNRTAKFVGDTFSANTADMQGGGIAIEGNATATISRSTFHGNHTAGSGGGMWMSGSQIRVEDSTIEFNSANVNGGGVLIVATGQDMALSQTTISGNYAGGNGGGVSVTVNSGTATIANSTITLNSAGSLGGGISASGAGALRMTHTIDSANVQFNKAPDLSTTVKTLDLTYSLIGTAAGTSLAPAPVGAPDAHGNLIGGFTATTAINPKLGPLDNNGGPTLTHAFFPGSPGINAGDPMAVPGVNGVPISDQRGAPFTRVYGGRIDIGAFEFQPTGGLVGDFNRNGIVDAGDYVIGRKQSGSTVVPASGADANGDGKVNDADLVLWSSNFGAAQSPAASSVVQQLSATEVATESPAASGQAGLPLQGTSKDPSNVGSHFSQLTTELAADVASPANRKVLKPLLRKPTTTTNIADVDLAIEAWLVTRASDGGKHSTEALSSKLNSADGASEARERRASLDIAVDDALAVL